MSVLNCQVSILISEKRKGEDLRENRSIFYSDTEKLHEQLGCFFATELPYLSGRISEAIFDNDTDLEFRSYCLDIRYGNKGVSESKG